MNSFENFNIPKKEASEKRKSLENREVLDVDKVPVIGATIGECKKITNDQEVLKNVQTYLLEYFQQNIENTKLYKSEKTGVSFPYNVVRLKDVAQKLFEKHGGVVTKTDQNQKLEMVENEEKSHAKKEIIFATFFDMKSAHPFHWVEHGIDQISKKLSRALEDIASGREVEDYEVYDVGSPAGLLGEVPSSFLEKMKGKPFESVGEVYAEFVSDLKKKVGENVPTDIRLWGVSMGASMAMTTAQSLLESQQATQSFEVRDETKNRLPKVDLVMVSPVATSKNTFRSYEIPLGFAAEIALQFSNEYARAVAPKEGDFTSMIYEKLREKGIDEHMSPEDIKNKKKVLSEALSQLRSGIPVPQGIQTNEIVGIFDPLMYSNEFRKQSNFHNLDHKGSLGEKIVPGEDENRRRFGINETHTPQVVRFNYFKRLIKVGEFLKELSQNTQN